MFSYLFRDCITYIIHVDSIATQQRDTCTSALTSTSLINYQLPQASLKTSPFVFPLTTRVLSRLISYMHDICINRTVISALFLNGLREDELLIHP